MNLAAIASYLQSKDCGITGKTIFSTEMPADCKEGILLMGPYYGVPIDQYLDGYYVSTFKLVARSRSYDTGSALVKKASGALKTHVGFTVDTMTVRQCLPDNLPRPYRRSVGGYWELEVDMNIVFLDSSN